MAQILSLYRRHLSIYIYLAMTAIKVVVSGPAYTDAIHLFLFVPIGFLLS